jgi:hypothetical protein
MELIIAIIIAVTAILTQTGCSTKLVAKNCMEAYDKQNQPQGYYVCEKE